MAKFHIQPETGNPTICRAKRRCPFGDLETAHYESPEAARAAYEAAQVVALGGLPMSHEPRANWVEVGERQEETIYANYSAALRSLKGGPYNRAGFSGAAKQKALKLTAERYGVPISQVKSLVRQLQGLEGRTEDSDRERHARGVRLMAVKKEWERVTFDEEGMALCHCGSADEVALRADPFQAEIHNTYAPMVSCIHCYERVAEDS